MSSSAHAWWDIVQVNIMFRHAPNVSANKKTLRSCLPDLPNKRDVNNHRIIKVSHYWTFLLWIWNSLVQKPHLRKMNTYHYQPLPKVLRIFWHSDIFSDVSMQYPFHHVCHEIEKYPQPLQFGFGSRLNAREIEKCKIILQPNWAPLSLPSYSNLGTKMWKFAASPKIGAQHCGVFQLPWWARRIFFYSEVKSSFSLAIIGCVRVEVFHFSIISPWCQGGSSRAWWAGSWHGGWSREGWPEGGFRLSLQPVPG